MMGGLIVETQLIFQTHRDRQPLAIGASGLGLSFVGVGQASLAWLRCRKGLQRYQAGMLADLKDCFRVLAVLELLMAQSFSILAATGLAGLALVSLSIAFLS